MTQPVNLSYSGIPIFNDLVPNEGPKCIPVILTGFPAAPIQSLDLQNVFARRYMSLIQTIFVDNSANSVPVSIQIMGSQQTITVPGQSQGYYPVLSPNPPKLIINGTGATGNLNIQLINVAMAGVVWSAVNNAFKFDANGYLYVDDPNLASTISSGRINVNTPAASAGAPTSVAASAASVAILAPNSSRKGATVFNDSTTATLYLLLGPAATAASTTVYTVQLVPGAYYEFPYAYQGAANGIWSAAVGNARITELT